ncbi:MAG: S41 family peptidase, partial [Cyclobacteriaceae bacterium]
MKRIKMYPLAMLAVFTLSFVFVGCDEDNPAPPNPNGDINAWIYDVMDEVYYWTDQLPAASSIDDRLDPVDYFGSLTVSQDRFSVIYEDYKELINNLEGISKEAGYEFQLFQIESGDIIAQIRYVKDESPADIEGLKRGDVITTINGTVMTPANYQEVLSQLSENHTITYERYNDISGVYEEMGELSLNTVVFAENPNALDTVYTFGDRKIGYFFYTKFTPGLDNTTAYDMQMDEIFDNFKNEGITDLVVDLRYNLGGAISSATNLASLIAPNVTSSDILYENRWNDLYQDYIEGLENGDDILRGKFIEKAGNVGAQLTGGKVYVLVGRQTASASELVINGLIPYMDVELIGYQTIGKNVGSIPIEDEDNPDNDYGLLPIVLKTFNSAGTSDYDQGFVPMGTNYIDEFNYIWYPEGDARDVLISRAVELITGEPVPSQMAGRVPAHRIGEPIYD